MKTDDPK